jgi:hypothetical protein
MHSVVYVCLAGISMDIAETDVQHLPIANTAHLAQVLAPRTGDAAQAVSADKQSYSAAMAHGTLFGKFGITSAVCVCFAPPI